ncbi:1-(5-phosphoribosyl)-5-((5-phosphoribosylamino)methylideneamino)imidazole-4-carboxamide isomerase [Ignisphaera sp. 4213-co]|uniref:1-(5-phosphoribosyl)-5-[(5-phosphoribosylamino)methylideneamino] imidazole-4-carboxamide isomerase n=1 Tax=Ignisphaera cupida TaxID=3050454 RepID=A0ABD4Z5T6_9CREN|nr:1-(5-phosphoribosyl)-5-((5-phosphoribosylamino)methylideneamino)imidazole-4-carboxamide isomerase [Ignisphaera sp. 4213-co]MDK6028377.1 1-(5-phosphoribosyl)-5-((5-phosphoribosylamino)methylideneamino)imidazole-4-carboxamide isomerase [Ignisphaera sp. 4213-co]
MIVVPSIDISNGVAVKRVKGVKGTELVLGNPLEVGNKLFEAGYEYIHIVDLDAAEGSGDNESIVKKLCKMGFKWIQVGGGIRNADKASRLISYGASAVVISTIFFTNRNEFEKILSVVGGDKVIIALDYDNDYSVRIGGWSRKAVKIYDALNDVSNYNVKGVLFTYVEYEGSEKGIDRNVKIFASIVKGIKEYAGGISSINDLYELKSFGIDYAVVGMALYNRRLWGVKSV